jgi:hypothetical protein
MTKAASSINCEFNEPRFARVAVLALAVTLILLYAFLPRLWQEVPRL